MSRYLEEAADLLRKAAATNETSHDLAWSAGRAALNEGRERIADAFADLAAIDKGLLPADLAREVLDRVARVNGGAR